MSIDPRDLFASLNPLGLDERELTKDSTGFADMRTQGDYLVFLAGYKAGTVDGERHECQRHHSVNAEGCKPDSNTLLSGEPCAGVAPYRSLDIAEGGTPDNNLLPCPFCGGKADSRCTAGPYPDWFVECTECHASASVISEDKLDGWNSRAQPASQATPKALMLAMENLAVKACVADHPPIYLPASERQAPLVMLGGVCLRVSYSGLKWYHDQLIGDYWEPLSVDEFEALLTGALRSYQGGNR